MKNSLSREDRRTVRSSLVAALAAAFTIALGSFAWAQVNTAAAERGTAVVVSAPAPASAPAKDDNPDTSAYDIGCGCAEPCVSQAP